MRRATPLLLASLFAPLAPVALADDAAAVRGLLDAQVAAWNRGDLEGYMAGYWNSPDLVFQSGSTVTRGWQATLERYRKRYQAEGKEMGQLAFEDVDVLALGPDAAMARGGWRLRMKDGTEPHGLFTVILLVFGAVGVIQAQ